MVRHVARQAWASHPDNPVWQGMALGQGLAGCRAALGGLRDTA